MSVTPDLELSHRDANWPDDVPAPDGIVPTAEVPQDADFLDDDEDEDLEMGDDDE